jgi:hypothetical protein
VTPKRPAVLPEELWTQLPAPVQVVTSAMVEVYEQRIAGLEAQVRELRAPLPIVPVLFLVRGYTRCAPLS